MERIPFDHDADNYAKACGLTFEKAEAYFNTKDDITVIIRDNVLALVEGRKVDPIVLRIFSMSFAESIAESLAFTHTIKPLEDNNEPAKLMSFMIYSILIGHHEKAEFRKSELVEFFEDSFLSLLENVKGDSYIMKAYAVLAFTIADSKALAVVQDYLKREHEEEKTENEREAAPTIH